jgi:hypothetical protein
VLAEHWRIQSAGDLVPVAGRSIRFPVGAGVVQTGRDITANRPAAASVGAGGLWYDTTLKKHISSDGTTIVETATVLTATATLDFPSVVAAGQQELTVTVTGAVVGDTVHAGAPAALEAGLAHNTRVTAANTVTVRVLNITASPIDPASASWKVTVIR